MEKWEIRATPSGDDPDRHVLLLKGGPSDVSALLKKFGALMGRPTPAHVDGFNLSLVLHKLKPAKIEGLSEACARGGILFRTIAPGDVQKKSTAVDVIVDMMLLSGEA